ncbi:DAO-domain-containing protein [Agrocybe pediades]|nr:DAO-domain-containing protein [Agrocybe pediades]
MHLTLLSLCLLSSSFSGLANASDRSDSDAFELNHSHSFQVVFQHDAGTPIHLRQRASLPVDNPTKSFWLDTAGANPLAEEGSKGPLTDKADVCIIGSGMTGSSAAWHLSNLFKEESSILRDPLSVVVLEARRFCSGATGRNGGHLTQNVASSFLAKEARYNTTEAVKSFLLEEYNAKKLVQFIKDRNLEETVDLVNGGHVTLFQTEREAKSLKEDWEAAKKAGFDTGARWVENEELHEKFGLSKNLNLTGLFFDAHNFWPCKVATELFREAENASPNVNVRLHTLTPVTSVTAVPDEMANGQSRWSLQTPRGEIGCKYVIHATNGYASHLLPFLAGVESPTDKETTDDALTPGWALNPLERPLQLFNRDTPRGAFGVIPTRGQIGTVRASVGPKDLGWLNSWDEHDGDEYWFPRYQDTKESTGGKNPLVVLGGGRRFSTHKETGITDDSSVNPEISRGMKKVMPELFPGKFNAPDGDGASWEMEWSGIMAFTSDGDPFVGPVSSPFKDGNVLGAETESNYDGQYLAVGFSGHGMPRAYACAEVVAGMIAAKIKGEEWTSPAWLPQHYLSWAHEP